MSLLDKLEAEQATGWTGVSPPPPSHRWSEAKRTTLAEMVLLLRDEVDGFYRAGGGDHKVLTRAEAAKARRHTQPFNDGTSPSKEVLSA